MTRSEDEREPYSWDAVEIGMPIGSIASLDQKRRSKKRHPIGFVAATKRTRKPSTSGGRIAGTFPEVPRFDLRGE